MSGDIDIEWEGWNSTAHQKGWDNWDADEAAEQRTERDGEAVESMGDDSIVCPSGPLVEAGAEHRIYSHPSQSILTHRTAPHATRRDAIAGQDRFGRGEWGKWYWCGGLACVGELAVVVLRCFRDRKRLQKEHD